MCLLLKMCGQGGSQGAIELFVEHNFDTGRAARPGWSWHCSGRAVDIGNIGKKDTPNLYHWLVKNASTFGFSPYAAEHWHWNHKA